ncbi:hypothetical protein EJ05DRAFT_504063 [Pseudovirgaria hyperparasitica]|uniref:Uncharacterized protein n=1 Tax=Pseudovirgaria hyperparasitica TaxID=470096 RepID=A0A6A6VYY9_9PEZI|nr:uncharacterized protein EJ05DRAFT_504063 [Pseudovirgaria hyperparasitica]KAF2754527.1 hypothetical protein EJ05DRAFT_504063 [Pseudovirgaria hyperparasitica]
MTGNADWNGKSSHRGTPSKERSGPSEALFIIDIFRVDPVLPSTIRMPKYVLTGESTRTTYEPDIRLVIYVPDLDLPALVTHVECFHMNPSYHEDPSLSSSLRNIQSSNTSLPFRLIPGRSHQDDAMKINQL